MNTRIAIDAMGGDSGLIINIEGALMAQRELPHKIILVGDKHQIEAELKRRNALGAFPIEHAGTVVGMHEKPAEACRTKKDSSIMVCARLVAEGKADAFLSAGNSGATMAASLWHLRRLPGVSRPAIATIMPTLQGLTVVLDVGANVDCKPKHLLQFAVMGSLYAQLALDKPSPRVGLLTIGEEEGKGNEVTVLTNEWLKTSGLNYIGHMEGRDIPKGNADVCVCDGFVGNIVLKFGEGLAEALLFLIKDKIKRHPLAILGKILMGKAFKDIKKITDPAEYGGAPLLGVNGVVIISHGGATPKAIKNAVAAAGRFVEKGINEHIRASLHRLEESPVMVKASA